MSTKSHHRWPSVVVVALVAVVLSTGVGLPTLLAATLPTEVSDAAERGDRQAVRALLRGGADVNAAQGDGTTALHWAALSGDVDLARMLIYAGASLRVSTRLGGYTPLLLAARRGDAAMSVALLEAGADPDAATTGGATPLMLAAAAGRPDALRALLEHGAEVNAVDKVHGQTALVFAAAANRDAAIQTLLAAGADSALETRVVDAVQQEKATRAAFRRRREQKKLAKAAEPKLESEEVDESEDVNESESEDSDESEGGLHEEASDELAATESGTNLAADAADPELAAEAERQAQKEERIPCIPYGGDEDATEGQSDDSAESSPAEPSFELSADELRRSETSASKPESAATVAAAQSSTTDNAEDSAKQKEKGRPCPMTFGQLVGKQGGLTALHHAARQGHLAAVRALLDGGADVNQLSGGDRTSPLLIAVLNGRFDLAKYLLERGADPSLASAAGATALYAVVNVHWAPHSFYPQPSAAQESTSHLELLQALIDHGADPNARLTKKLWYTGYNFDQSGVDESGATAFFRAAQAADVPAMRLLLAAGADPTIATLVVPERRLPNGRNADADLDADPPELGSPAVTPLQIAAGAGYVGNYHRIAAAGFLPAVRYLVEELGADVSAADHRGYTPLHNAAARGDNEMILYLVSKGADVTAVTRDGMTTADLANGPVQRIQPFPETIELLISLGAVNNDRCVSC